MKLYIEIISLFIFYDRMVNGMSMNTTEMTFGFNETVSTEFYPETTESCDSPDTLTPESDPTANELANCLFDATVTINSAYDAYVTICGFEEGDDMMISVSASFPAKKWAAFGFVNDANFDEDDQFKGYTIFVPINSRDLEERYLEGEDEDTLSNGEIPGISLPSSATVYSDMVDGEMRTIKFSRPVTITEEDIGSDSGTDIGYYFDFSSFFDCGDSIKLIWEHGNLECQGLGSYTVPTSDNHGYKTLEIDSVEGEECIEDDSMANQYMVHIGMIVSCIIFMLL